MNVAEFHDVTRICVVSPDGGIAYEKYGLWRREGVEIHLQDDGQTLKIFPRHYERPTSVEDVWDVIEKYLETKLFRDANIPEVNSLLQDFIKDIRKATGV